MTDRHMESRAAEASRSEHGRELAADNVGLGSQSDSRDNLISDNENKTYKRRKLGVPPPTLGAQGDDVSLHAVDCNLMVSAETIDTLQFTDASDGATFDGMITIYYNEVEEHNINGGRLRTCCRADEPKLRVVCLK